MTIQWIFWGTISHLNFLSYLVSLSGFYHSLCLAQPYQRKHSVNSIVLKLKPTGHLQIVRAFCLNVKFLSRQIFPLHLTLYEIPITI